MVLVRQMGAGEFQSVQANRPPMVTDDALKKTCCMNVKKFVNKLVGFADDLALVASGIPIGSSVCGP